MSHLRELDELPKFREPVANYEKPSRLAIEGEILEDKVLSLDVISRLPTVKLTEDFECLEGWVVRDVL
jgi:DMSO/TMAO reductase YedYZ molybdopterin-dependent catalytic subunit